MELAEDRQEAPESTADYVAALHAACLNLSAPQADLEQLLDPIQALQIPPQQVSGLLKQLWERLSALRRSESEVSAQLAQPPELRRVVKQAFGCLHATERLSLVDADAGFEDGYRQGLAYGIPAEHLARIRALQAQIAALRRDYRHAARLFADAADTPGLHASGQWQYQLQHALALEDQSREFMDAAALEMAVDRLETQVLALAPKATRPDDWAKTQHHLGNALGALGQRQRGSLTLEKSIAAFEDALTIRSRERSPDDWAATQNSLGVTLGILAHRRADPDLLGAAVTAFERALEERSRDRSPHDWAVTQNNLAAALGALGQRKQDRTLLKRASEAYKNVLQVWTRARMPLEWAATMDNLGTALRLLGEQRKGPRTLEQAVAAFHSALAERTRARVPEAWAMTQNNLGAALHKLGERQNDAEALEASVHAYTNALETWTRDHAPVAWAMTLANRGAALKALAQCVGDAELARRALTDFAAVAQVFRGASHAQYYELVTEQLALTRKLEQALMSDAHGRAQSDIRAPA